MKRLFTFAAYFLLLASALFSQPKGVYLGELTWPDAEKRLRSSPLVIIPFGAGAKEHGPHLPMNADQKVMEYLCAEAVDSLSVIVTPPILHGWFPAFRDFPGTEVASPAVFRDYIFAVANSLIKHGALRIVFLNTGIFKATGLPISIAARELRVQSGTPTLVVSWDDLETDEIESMQEQKAGGHGDEIETSIHLYLQPEKVHMERAVTDYGAKSSTKSPGYKPGLFSRNPNDPAFSETGILGNPKLATAEKGEKALRIMTRQWLNILRNFMKEPLPKQSSESR